MFNLNDDKEYLFYYKDIHKRFETIWQDYREHVEFFYGDVYAVHPEYFPLYKGFNVDYVSLSKGIYRAIAFYKSGSSSGVHANEIKLPENFIETSTNRNIDDLCTSILKQANLNISNYYLNKAVFMSKMTSVASYHADGGMGMYFANKDAEKYGKDSKISLQSLPSKVSEQSITLPSTISKYRPLLDAINDQEFAFEVRQAYGCYKNQLFLPCALTVGRLLETVCQLLIKQKHEDVFYKIKSRERTVGTFADKLEQLHLLNAAEKNDLLAASMYRNTVAHATSATDFQVKIQEMFRMVKILVEKYQDEK